MLARMKQALSHLACMLVGWLLAATAATAAGKPVLTWMVLDLPPGSMPVNGQLTDGINDRMLKMVIAELPGYEHRIVVANTARAMADLAEGKQACFGSAAYSADRERVAYFTLAYLIPPLHIVARADTTPRLPMNARGEVLAPELFARSDLQGLVVPQRAYSQLLDDMLKQRPADSGVRQVLANDGGANILKMLKLRRGDYTVEYDFVANYLIARTADLAGTPFSMLPIAGAEPLPVGIACPHTEWGRQIIEQVDAALVRLAVRPAFREALLRWLPADSARRYQPAIEAFLERRAKASPATAFPRWPSAR